MPSRHARGAPARRQGAYEIGAGVDKDMKEAVATYRRGAALNDPICTRALAVMYEQGDGVKSNMDKAIAWYQRASALGDERAKASLAVLTINGMLTSFPDYKQGAKLLKEATANGGDADYILKLAQMTEKGVGMAADPATAAKL